MMFNALTLLTDAGADAVAVGEYMISLKGIGTIQFDSEYKTWIIQLWSQPEECRYKQIQDAVRFISQTIKKSRMIISNDATTDYIGKFLQEIENGKPKGFLRGWRWMSGDWHLQNWLTTVATISTGYVESHPKQKNRNISDGGRLRLTKQGRAALQSYHNRKQPNGLVRAE